MYHGDNVFTLATSALRVTEADHCDYERPADALCSFACPGTNSRFSDEEIQSLIAGLSTAALLDAAGLVTDADEWLAPGGAFYDPALSGGALSVP